MKLAYDDHMHAFHRSVTCKYACFIPINMCDGVQLSISVYSPEFKIVSAYFFQFVNFRHNLIWSLERSFWTSIMWRRRTRKARIPISSFSVASVFGRQSSIGRNSSRTCRRKNKRRQSLRWFGSYHWILSWFFCFLFFLSWYPCYFVEYLINPLSSRMEANSLFSDEKSVTFVDIWAKERWRKSSDRFKICLLTSCSFRGTHTHIIKQIVLQRRFIYPTKASIFRNYVTQGRYYPISCYQALSVRRGRASSFSRQVGWAYHMGSW